MYEELMGRHLYVGDEETVECYEPDCKCKDGFIAFPGRRVTVEEFLKALKDHWGGLSDVESAV